MAEFHRKTRRIDLLHRCLLNAWVNDEGHYWKLNLAVPDDSAVHQTERKWRGQRVSSARTLWLAARASTSLRQ
jgi:hypothetical protein